MILRTAVFSIAFLASASLAYGGRVVRAREFGILPDVTNDAAEKVASFLPSLSGSVRLTFEPGEYHFYWDHAAVRTWYVSNTDQTNPRRVAFPLEGVKDFTLDGGGARFIFHGRMIPLGAISCTNVSLKNFSVDFADPTITQFEVLKVDAKAGTVELRPSSETSWRVEKNRFFARGGNWTNTPIHGILFDPVTGHIPWGTSDFNGINFHAVDALPGGLLRSRGCKRLDELRPGLLFAARPWERPSAGFFFADCKNVVFQSVSLHFSEGLGVIAQGCENLTLDGFNVCRSSRVPERRYTLHADATHFSGCFGEIRIENGIFEAMMDDAVNVHGVYLRVTQRIDARTLEAEYAHGQAWGFPWGAAGETVQLVRADTLENLGTTNCIVSITALDGVKAAGVASYGMKRFRIRLADDVPPPVAGVPLGLENMTRHPTVVFRGNTVRNNRARGALFSSSRRTLCESNLFDHVSGCAILLCGDCNGWYESGACTDVIIRNNVFRDCLTSRFQFTEAVISISPEIPKLVTQQRTFHRNLVIENNRFEVFEKPLLFAKSVDGLRFSGNTVVENRDYPPLIGSPYRVIFQRVTNAVLSGVSSHEIFNRGENEKME